MLFARNLKVLGLAIVLLVSGYILLGQGPVDNHLSWSFAPIILVVTYCVILPVSILLKGKEPVKAATQKSQNQGV